MGEILEEVKAGHGANGSVPVFLSSELYPMRRDLPRLNSTLIEAYAAEPSRRRCAPCASGPRSGTPASSCG